jgi:hypothetical protein
MELLATLGPTDWAPHLDHELAQIASLQGLFAKWWYRFLPETARRSCRVAYAAHFRVLMEFCHAGRPAGAEMGAAGCEPPSDLRPADFGLDCSVPTWTTEEMARLCDADKLLGHLSKARVAREQLGANWGSRSDLMLWNKHFRSIVVAIGPSLLPRAAKALANLR